MIEENALELIRMTLLIVLVIAAPLLVAGMIIGLVISLIQSITSIQDQTLTFVPKIIAVVVVAVFLLPWITSKLIEFAGEMLSLF